MSEYTYADVIIDPTDPRVKIGQRYYFGDTPKEALDCARANGEGVLLEDIDTDLPKPFATCDYEDAYPCLIRKKEPEKKYVPFDLSDPGVRKSLRGKWIKDGAGEEACITGFKCDDEEDWIAEIPNGYIAATALASCWMFDDNSPCGKLVEEE